jgi:hypothetical protein
MNCPTLLFLTYNVEYNAYVTHLTIQNKNNMTVYNRLPQNMIKLKRN